MATSAWSTEAWTDTQQSAGGVTDLSKLYWTADWSAEADGYSLAGSQGEAYGIQTARANVSSNRMLNGRKSAIETYGPSLTSDIYPVGFDHYVPLSTIPNTENAEVWLRVWIWHETGYTFHTTAGPRKTMRFGEYKNEDYSGYYGGYCDLYTISWDGVYANWKEGGMMHIRETDPDRWVNIDRNADYKFEFGKWECLEYYVKASEDPTKGVVKVWRDGVLVNSVVAKTRVNPDTRLCRIMYISNWNYGLNKEVTQSWCAPAIAVRSSTRDDVPHMARDSQGFPYIGTAN